MIEIKIIIKETVGENCAISVDINTEAPTTFESNLGLLLYKQLENMSDYHNFLTSKKEPEEKKNDDNK